MKGIVLGGALAVLVGLICAQVQAQSLVRPAERPAAGAQPEDDLILINPAFGAADAAAIEPPQFSSDLRPPARAATLPRTRFQHMQDHAMWTRVALAALKSHGQPLVEMVPGDVTDWCPAYPQADAAGRRAFWVGFLSALSKHESTYRASAVGGGGRWYGLLQILPATARGYGCNVGTGSALKNGGANLSCAVRIMAVTVPRDGVIYGRGGRGVAADWGPLRSAAKRRDMAGWLRRQAYCEPLSTTRPQSRP